MEKILINTKDENNNEHYNKVFYTLKNTFLNQKIALFLRFIFLKKVQFMLTLLFTIIFLNGNIYGSNVIDEVSEVIDMEDLKNIDNVINQRGIENLNVTDIFKKVLLGENYNFLDALNEIKNIVYNDYKGYVNILTNIMLITILQGFLGNISESFKSKNVAKIGTYVIYVAFITSVITTIYETVRITSDYLSFASDFTLSLVPIYVSILGLNLKVTSATSLAPIILFLSKLIIHLYSNVILNLIYIFSIMNLINLIAEKQILNNYIKIGIKVIKAVIKYLTQGYIFVISLVGIGSPIANNLITKTGKYAVKSVPIIGNTLGSAMDSMLLIGDSTKRGFVFAIVLVSIIILLLYIIKIFVINIIFYIASIICSPVAEGNIIKALNTSSVFFEMLISVCVSTAFMITYTMLIILFV